ncbi:MAG: tRNA (adenosine(37)-N6)-dimethylallyltransferase MiaA [Thermodesulfobacteriota bacterium]|nr:tRNA (adenosine(37)-N6)-dimethylallyltransferase MiaA [Thermodesulfobacteriota bacterium]
MLKKQSIIDADMPKPRVIVICGPTGVGKTSSVIEIAKEFNGEIINADSMQIYKYMDIGTAKPTLKEQACVKHHMIDIVNPDEPFDAAKFAKMARRIIMQLYKRNITPFIVGGTGFYIKALLYGLFQAEPVDPDFRLRLKNEAEIDGAAFLHKRLKKYDPDTAEKIHPNDTYRIIRALEILEATGKTISEYHREHRFADNPFEVLTIGLHMNREVLYDRINRRVDTMISAGLLDEVKRLIGMGLAEELKPMQSIGYRHMIDFIKGRISWDDTLQTFKRDTRRYAKRQFTWFKADPDILWTEPKELTEMCRLIKNFL